MKIFIKTMSGEFVGRDGEFDRDEVTISRSAEADVQVHPTNEAMVGRRQHARLMRGQRDASRPLDHARCAFAAGPTVQSQIVHEQHLRGRRRVFRDPPEWLCSPIPLLEGGDGGGARTTSALACCLP